MRIKMAVGGGDRDMHQQQQQQATAREDQSLLW